MGNSASKVVGNGGEPDVEGAPPTSQASTVNNTETSAYDAKKLDSRWPHVRESVKEMLDYIVKAEEAAHDKDTFQKISDPDCTYDWSENHFLSLDDGKEEPKPKKSSKRVNVITHSYYLSDLSSRLDPDLDEQDKPFSVSDISKLGSPWLRFDLATEKNYCSEADDDDFTRAINLLKKLRNTPANKDLSVEEIALKYSFSDVGGKFKSLNDEERDSLTRYLRHLVDKRVTSLNQALYGIKEEVANGNTEIFLGLGHVRRRYSTGEGEKKKHKIVNGPLLEIPLQLDYDRDNRSASLFPRKNSSFRVNGSVLSCLRKHGGDDEPKVHPDSIQNLLEKVQETRVSELLPGNPEAFPELLKIAKLIRFNSSFTSRKSPDVHKVLPESDTSTTIFSDAWCLYSCKSKNNEKVFLQDAIKLRKAMDADENFEIPPAFYALTGKPAVLDEIAKYHRRKTFDESQLMFPLPATKDQQNIAKRLHEGAPAVILQGPAGNGKTQTIANCVALAVSQGQKCCISSSNPIALRAFVDKLPGNFKNLCVDFSSCENGNIPFFSKCLHSLQEHLEKVVNNTKEHQSNIEAYKKCMEDKKGKLSKIKETQRRRGETSLSLLEDEETATILRSSVDLTMEAPWLVSMVVSKKGNTFFDELSQLVQCEQREANETSQVDFNVDIDQVNLKLLASYIKMHASPSCDEELESDPFDDVKYVASTTSEDGEVPHGMTLDGNPPSGFDQWQRCSQYIDLLRRRDAFLSAWGCRKQQIYESSGAIRCLIIRCIPQCDILSNKLKKLTEEKRANFFEKLAESSDSKTLQAECRQLTSEIQELSQKLVFEQFVVDLGNKLTPDDLSSLERLMQQVDIQASNTFSESKGVLKPADQRHLLALTESFQEAVKFLPFVAMTDKQVSQHVLPTHKFDLMVVDEASQSNYKAITSLIRGRQLLVVGDSKQVTPTSDISEERLKELEIYLPAIAVKDSLLPESSVFDLCKRCFPQCTITLKHHFRSDPRIIGISNECFYGNSLVPLKSPGNEQAVEFVERVGGQADARVNENEAEYITERIAVMIKAAFRERKLNTYSTIGVICLDGPSQCERINKLLDHKLEEYKLRLGGKRIVDSHNILVDVPEGFQGDERDVVFVSAVCSAKQKNPKKSPKLTIETSPAFKKKLNVTLSRAKKLLVWVSSYDMRNLQSGDVRVDVLNALKEATRNEEDLLLSTPLTSQGIEGKLISQLKDQGLNVDRNGGRIWKNALLIRHQTTSCNALLHLEHVKGDSEAKWVRLVDEQESLERAGRACLRVDVVSMILNFETTLLGVLAFLKESGLPTVDTDGHHSVSSVTSAPQDSPILASIMVQPASISDLDESSKSDSSMTKSKKQIVQRDTKRHAQVAADTAKTDHKRAKTVPATGNSVVMSLKDAQKEYKLLATKKTASAVVQSGKNVAALTNTDLKALIGWKTGKPCPSKSKKEELFAKVKDVFKDQSEMAVHWTAEDEKQLEQCKSIIAAANDNNSDEMS